MCCFIVVPRYPDAEQLVPTVNMPQSEINKRINAQRRMCSYRSLIFWTFPDIRRRERRPLPACVYGMVRAAFPAEEDEELWADLQHTLYAPEPDDDD